jgi:hypothetical protein
VDLTFGEPELAALCNSEQRMIRRWGHEGFRILARRLLELAAADVSEIEDLPGAALRFDGDGGVTVDFGRGALLIHAVFLNGRSGRGPDATTAPDRLHILRIETAKGSGES